MVDIARLKPDRRARDADLGQAGALSVPGR